LEHPVFQERRAFIFFSEYIIVDLRLQMTQNITKITDDRGYRGRVEKEFSNSPFTILKSKLRVR